MKVEYRILRNAPIESCGATVILVTSYRNFWLVRDAVLRYLVRVGRSETLF